MRRLVTRLLAVGAVLALATAESSGHGRDWHDDDKHHHDHDHHADALKISPTRDLVVPKSWAGEWHITTKHHARDRHVVTAVDDVTGFIRAGEPVGLSLLTRGGLASCAGRFTDRGLEVSCNRRLSNGVCHVATVVRVELERDRDVLAGSALAITTIVGRCGDVPNGRTHTSLEMHGTRVGRDRSTPRQSLPPLLTRFVLSAPLFTFLATAPQVTPVVEDDCEDGAWRAFTSPPFRNESQCLRVVRDRDHDHDHHGRHDGKDGRR